MKAWIVVASLLLVAVPVGLSARHVVRQHAAAQVPRPQAANPNCAFGATPPAGTSCSISDYTAGGALSATDEIAICQVSGGCFASSPTIAYKQVPILSSIRGSLSATAPFTYNSSTGVFGGTLANPSATKLGTAAGTLTNGHCVSINATGDFVDAGGACTTGGGGGTVTASPQNTIAYYSSAGTTATVSGLATGTNGQVLTLVSGVPTWSAGGGGGLTGLTVSPGLTVVPGSYNPGTGTPATLVNGSQISPQLFWEGHATSCTINSTCGSTNDSGKLLEATAAGVTFTLPAIGAAGSGSYSFSFNQANGNPYTVATGGTTTIYGCGPSGTGVTSIQLSNDAAFIPTSSGWKCSSSNIISVFPLSWGPGMNLATSPTPLVRRSIATQLTGYLCMPGVLVSGTPASIDLIACPDGTVGSVPPTGGCIYIATTASTAPVAGATCHAGTYTGPPASAAGTLQSLIASTSGTGIIPAGNTVWAVGSGAGWSSANVTSSSGMIQIAVSP